MSTLHRPAYWLTADLSTAQKVRAFEQVPLAARGLPNNVYELLANSCAQDPEAEALVFFTDPERCVHTQTVWSYAQLRARVAQFANLLRSCGVTEESGVSLMLANTPDCLVAFLAAQSVAVANPVNWMLAPAAIADILRRAQTRVLCAYVGDAQLSFWDKIPQIIEHYPQLQTVICLDEFGEATLRSTDDASWPQGVQCLSYVASRGAHAEDLDPATLPRGEALTALFPTSGTTGAPKLIPHTQDMAVQAAWLSALTVGMQERESRLCATPLFHVVGIYSGCLATLARGARVIFPTAAGWRHPQLIPHLWSVVEALAVNYLSVVPTILNQLAQMPVDRDSIRSLKAVTSGSAPLSQAIAQRFERLTGRAVREGYGLTETTSAVMMNPAEGEIKVGSSGLLYPYHRAWLRPLEVAPGDEPGYATEAVGAAGMAELAEGAKQSPDDADGASGSAQAGELVISGPQVAASPLYTGDLARIDEDGYIWVIGRLKDVIIRGGHNIDPKMVEDVFYQHPQVLDAVVVGQPDAYAGEIPVVYVQPKAGERLDAQELMAFVAEHALERAAIPKHCRIVPAIPQSSVGKILRPEVQLWAIRDGVMDCVQSVLQARASHFTAKDNTDAAAEVGAEAAAEVGARAAAETEAQGDAQLLDEVSVQVQRRADGSVAIELQHGPKVRRADLEQAVAQLALAVTIRPS